VTIAQDALENIVVLQNGKSIATAKLVRYGKQYALEIMELTDE
jgi:flagellar motor switch/type III secretory pathway protein FliN